MAYPFPLPAGVTNTNIAYFFANNTNQLGTFIKQVNDLSVITVDYTQVTPAISLSSVEQFIISVGGNPPLVISNPSINPTQPILTFLLSNGIAGVQYTLSVVVNLVGGDVRTDVVTINIPSTGDGATMPPNTTPVSGVVQQGVVSPDGSIYYNQALRWFISGTPPVNPNVMDQWYNTNTGLYSQYVTNGVTPQWVVNESLLNPDLFTQFNTLLAAAFAGLPTSLPATSGVIWNNGGVITIS